MCIDEVKRSGVQSNGTNGTGNMQTTCHNGKWTISHMCRIIKGTAQVIEVSIKVSFEGGVHSGRIGVEIEPT